MKYYVIGMGYVGLPLLVEIAKAGHIAVGVDIDERKVNSVNAGESYIEDVPESQLRPLVEAGLLSGTTDFSSLKEADVISICVPTPLRKTKDPDISFIIAAVNEIANNIQEGQLIILESTTYPGTTDEVILPALSKDGMEVGKNFYLAFSPERVDPGNKVYTTKNTPKIIGGLTPECTKKAIEAYGKIFDTVVPVSSTRCAEMVKLLENTFRSVNIGLVNEVALMCHKLGLDVWEVIGSAATKPFGFMPFYPGPGLGGHCIPIDPHYLSWKLKTLNYYAKFIELAGDINANMPAFVVSRIADALNDEGKPLSRSKIFVLGIAYKKDVGDVRESPAIDVIELLKSKNADVFYNDPYIPLLHETKEEMHSVDITPEYLQNADCVVIITNHSCYDYQFICDNSRLIFDSRNAAKGIKGQARIVKL